MLKLDLQKHSGIAVSTITDAGVDSVTLDPSGGSYSTEDEVDMTIALEEGAEIDQVKVIQGDAVVEKGDDEGEYTITVGEADSVIHITTKPDNLYKVVENHTVIINAKKTVLTRNLMLRNGIAGSVVGVDCEGTQLEFPPEVIDSLVKAGIIIKL